VISAHIGDASKGGGKSIFLRSEKGYSLSEWDNFLRLFGPALRKHHWLGGDTYWILFRVGHSFFIY
jgi:hypothetical protein